MLTIKAVEDKSEAVEFLKKIGAAADIENDIVMTERDADGILGVGTLTLNHGKVYLNKIDFPDGNEDFSLKLGLAKSLLNLADLRGIRVVYGNNHALDRLYTALRFQEDGGEYRLSLEGYFTVGEH